MGDAKVAKGRAYSGIVAKVMPYAVSKLQTHWVRSAAYDTPLVPGTVVKLTNMGNSVYNGEVGNVTSKVTLIGNAASRRVAVRLRSGEELKVHVDNLTSLAPGAVVQLVNMIRTEYEGQVAEIQSISLDSMWGVIVRLQSGEDIRVKIEQ